MKEKENKIPIEGLKGLAKHAEYIAQRMEIDAAAILMIKEGKTAMVMSSTTDWKKEQVVDVLRKISGHIKSMADDIESEKIKPEKEEDEKKEEKKPSIQSIIDGAMFFPS